MAKHIVVPAAAATGILTALDAQNRVARTRGIPGAAIAHLCPATWDGTGSPPLGWTLPLGVIREPGGARVAIVAPDSFAAGKAQFASALDALPADWQAVDVAVVDGSKGLR